MEKKTEKLYYPPSNPMASWRANTNETKINIGVVVNPLILVPCGIMG